MGLYVVLVPVEIEGVVANGRLSLPHMLPGDYLKRLGEATERAMAALKPERMEHIARYGCELQTRLIVVPPPSPSPSAPA